MQKEALTISKSQQLKKNLEDGEIVGKILLICDFTGKIVFWKGDSKVLQTPSCEYLHKNLFSFNFTLCSRLRLTSHLSVDIFKLGQRETFNLELIKNSCLNRNSFLSKASRTHPKRVRKYLNEQIKLLKISASCIYGHAKRIENLVYQQCSVEFIQKERKSKTNDKLRSLENNQIIDKFIMFQIQQMEKPNRKKKQDQTYVFYERHTQLRDLQYFLRKRDNFRHALDRKYKGPLVKRQQRRSQEQIDVFSSPQPKSLSHIIRSISCVDNEYHDSSARIRRLSDAMMTPQKDTVKIQQSQKQRIFDQQ